MLNHYKIIKIYGVSCLIINQTEDRRICFM